MQDPKNQPLPCSAIIMQANDGQTNWYHLNRSAYEQADGGIFTNQIQESWFGTSQTGDNQTIGEVFSNAQGNVMELAQSKELSQNPVMRVYGDENAVNLPFKDTMMKMDHVLFVVPTYVEDSKYPPLAGARYDLIQFLNEIYDGKGFTSKCKILVLADGVAHNFDCKNMEFLSPTQAEARARLTQIMTAEGNVAVFVFAHGDRAIFEGRQDEYLVIDESDPKGRIFGMEVARLVVERIEKKIGFLFAFIDKCDAHGWPGQDDMDRALQEWTQPTAPGITAEGLAQLPVARWNPGNGGAPTHELPEGVNARGAHEMVNQLHSFWKELPEHLIMGWNTLEAAYGHLFGTGVLSMGLPWLIAAFLVTAGAGIWLYLRFIVRHHAGTFFTMLVVFVVTSLLPYLCDPVMLQRFFSVENSIYVGLACTGASFIVLLVSVAADWSRVTSRVSAVLKATNLAGRYNMIARVVLEMHLLDAGHNLQQTVHIRVGKVERLVMYYPMMRNKTHQLCPVRLTNNNVKLLLKETGFTVLNMKLGEGTFGDLTCMRSVMNRQVKEHSGGSMDSIRGISLDYGKHFLDLSEIHLDTAHVMNRFRANTTLWSQHPVLSKVAIAEKLSAEGKHDTDFDLLLPTVTKKPQATTLEFLAAPFVFLVEKLAGLLTPAPLAAPSREL